MTPNDIFDELDKIGLRCFADKEMISQVSNDLLEEIMDLESCFSPWFVELCKQEFERRLERTILGD
jgi:hypothetical protein